MEGLKLVPSLFQGCMSGQTPSLHHSLPTKMNSLHALNMSFLSENTAVQSLKNSLQVMPYTIFEKKKMCMETDTNVKKYLEIPYKEVTQQVAPSCHHHPLLPDPWGVVLHPIILPPSDKTTGHRPYQSVCGHRPVSLPPLPPLIYSHP